jgi:hypothetical protein
VTEYEHTVRIAVNAQRAKDWRPVPEWDYLDYERAIELGVAKVLEVREPRQVEVKKP